MKILFASDYINGTNTEAICNVAMKRGIDCSYFSKNEKFGNYQHIDIAITNNGRWIQDRNIKLKVNTQHGQGFLGDSTPENGIHVCLVSCDAERDKYIENGYDPQNLIVAGRPRIDPVFESSRELEKIRKGYLLSLGLDPNKRTIVYAPTYDRKAHGGGTKGFYARWCSKEEEIEASLNLVSCSIGCNLIIRLHKYYARQYKNLMPDHLYKIFKDKAVITSNATHPNSIPILIAADVLITDFSSIAFDYLVMNKPIIFIEPHDKWKYTSQWLCPKEDRAKMGIIAREPFDLWKFITTSTHWNDAIKPLRETMRKRYVQFFDGLSSERALDEILRIYYERYS